MKERRENKPRVQEWGPWPAHRRSSAGYYLPFAGDGDAAKRQRLQGNYVQVEDTTMHRLQYVEVCIYGEDRPNLDLRSGTRLGVAVP